MSFIKHGSPEPIEPEAERQQKTSARETWDERAQEALANENARAADAERDVERPETD